MSKVRIYLDAPEYIIKLEDEQGRLFVHLEVFKWNKEIKAELLDELNKIKEKAYIAGYSFIHTYTRNPKFCMVMGGFHVMNYGDYEVWSWALK